MTTFKAPLMATGGSRESTRGSVGFGRQGEGCVLKGSGTGLLNKGRGTEGSPRSVLSRHCIRNQSESSKYS